jgi:hypothetical protein
MPQPPPLPSPPPLTYASPGDDFRPPPIAWSLTVPLWTVGFLLLAFLLLAVPKFEQIFKDFKTELPFVTRLLLGVSRWVCSDYGWVFMTPAVVALPILLGCLIGLGARSQAAYRSRTRWARLLVYMTIILVVLMTVWSLFAPMIALVNSVSSGGSKR